MSTSTILQQGRFTSDGTLKTLVLRSDVDWVRVYNFTQAGLQQAAGRGVQFEWFRGMADGSGIEYKKENGVDTLSMVALTTGGFTRIDTSMSPLGALDATITAVSTATPPVVTVNSTASLSTGDVVRLYDVTTAEQLGGLDFTITVLDGTTFSLPYMATLGTAGTTGAFRVVKYSPIFYPSTRFISSITQAQQAVVTLTVAHNLTVGQKIRFQVPAEYGMTELDGKQATIVAVQTTATVNTITVDIDTTGFTPFAFPDNTAVPFTPAQIVPFGQAAQGQYVNNLDGATRNVSLIGMNLAAGIDSPAGSANDVIYWVAGKSFSVEIE